MGQDKQGKWKGGRGPFLVRLSPPLSHYTHTDSSTAVWSLRALLSCAMTFSILCVSAVKIEPQILLMNRTNLNRRGDRLDGSGVSSDS